MRPSIAKLLVADRGATARRILRTAREMGITTVVPFTEADREAAFVADADEAVALDRLSDRGAEAHFDGPALVEAARRAGVDAVHPGCGLLAEDAGFAWRCGEAGLIFVGPAPEAIATLASKLEAKALAAEAGVPVLAAEEVDGYPPGKLEAAAEVLGWPVVVKAAAGAGGRGLRVVGEGDDLVGAVEAVRREATASVGDGTVFLEPWLAAARHLEVQVFADGSGRVVHLFERDCSFQHRHRKVLCEAPAPRLPQPRRERLLAAAVAVAEAVGYVGAGTVEFLVDGDRFWFSEMNTRLDVDHTVTETVLGLDLVRMQLTAAEGRPLPVEARHCSPSGHAVAARLCAEPPPAGSGSPGIPLRRFEADPLPGVRVESVGATDLPAGEDGLLATLTAHASSRSEAIRLLASALERLRLHGPPTNRDRLVAALRHPGLAAGDAAPDLLEGTPAPRGSRPETLRLHAVAAALAGPARPPAGSALFSGPDGGQFEVAYRRDPAGAVVEVRVDGVVVHGLRVGAVTAEAVDLEIDGVRRRVSVSRTAGLVDCDSRLGHTELRLLRACHEAGP